MEDDKKKKSKRLIIGIISAVILVVIVGVVIVIIQPYYELKDTIASVVEDDYSYSLEYSIKGLNLDFGDKLLNGIIEGEKKEDLIRGSVVIEDTQYLEVYTNSDGECLFNIEPVFEILLDMVKESSESTDSKIALNLLSLAIKDTYVSLEQIQTITSEEKVNQLENVEVFSKLFSSWKMKKIKRPKKIDREYLKVADFFELSFEDSDIKIIIGNPKGNSNKMYLQATYDNIILEIDALYNVKDIKYLSMPKQTVSDKTISVCKDIYERWSKIKGKK